MGSGVIRVIVVVACSVFTSAARLCWIIIIIISALSASNYDFCSSYLASSGFDVCVQMSNTATACKNLFLCARNIKQDSCHALKSLLKTYIYIILLVQIQGIALRFVINPDSQLRRRSLRSCELNAPSI